MEACLARMCGVLVQGVIGDAASALHAHAYGGAGGRARQVAGGIDSRTTRHVESHLAAAVAAENYDVGSGAGLSREVDATARGSAGQSQIPSG